jgi:hypothetical protein
MFPILNRVRKYGRDAGPIRNDNRVLACRVAVVGRKGNPRGDICCHFFKAGFAVLLQQRFNMFGSIYSYLLSTVDTTNMTSPFSSRLKSNFVSFSNSVSKKLPTIEVSIYIRCRFIF